jgi:hypothetical protein
MGPPMDPPTRNLPIDNSSFDLDDFEFMSPSDNLKFKNLLDALLNYGLSIADHLRDFSLDGLDDEPFYGVEKISYPGAILFFGMIHYIRRFRELNKISGFPVRQNSFVILVHGCMSSAESYVSCHVDDERCKWGPREKGAFLEFIRIAKKLEDFCRRDEFIFSKFRDPVNPGLRTPDVASSPGRKTAHIVVSCSPGRTATKRKLMSIREEEDEPQRNLKRPMTPHEFDESTCSEENTQVGESSRKQASPKPAPSGMTYSREQCGAPSSSTATSEAELRGGQSCSTPSYSSEVPRKSPYLFNKLTMEQVITRKTTPWDQQIKKTRTFKELDKVVDAGYRKSDGRCVFCNNSAFYLPKCNLKQHFPKCKVIKERIYALEGPIIETDQTSPTPQSFIGELLGQVKYPDQAYEALPPTPRALMSSPIRGVSGSYLARNILKFSMIMHKQHIWSIQMLCICIFVLGLNLQSASINGFSLCILLYSNV